jgi:hypothetical protein
MPQVKTFSPASVGLFYAITQWIKDKWLYSMEDLSLFLK